MLIKVPCELAKVEITWIESTLYLELRLPLPILILLTFINFRAEVRGAAAGRSSQAEQMNRRSSQNKERAELTSFRSRLNPG